MSASDAQSSNEPASAPKPFPLENAQATADAPVPKNAPSSTYSDAPAPAAGDAPSQVDAPAPVEALPPGAADEMIAQAAGEQIDELLAKAGLDEFSATNIEGKAAPDEAPARAKPRAVAPGAGESSSAQNVPSQPTSTEADAVEPNDDDAAKEQEKIPAWLIPLELLNRPFELLPDSIRSALGKAAILTLINATALLIYVFKFRK